MRRALACLVAGLVLAACTNAPAASPPASQPASAASGPLAIGVATRGELENVLQARQQALASKDLKKFQATVDLTRPAFRRCQQETFAIASRQGAPSTGPRVARVESYGDLYARAYFEEDVGLARAYFRRDGERWILTEPKVDELGGERSKTVSGIRVDYWGVDEDIVEMVGAAAAETREYVKTYANGPLKEPFSVRLIPTRETAGIVACGFTAFMNTRDERAPFMGIWMLWLANDGRSVSDYMRAVFHHEGLHYAQDQFIHRITVRLDWWLVEGWPDYVAKTRSADDIRDALCQGSLPTLKRLIDGVPTAPDTPPELTGQFYALANAMIEYVYATYGAQSYWDLVALYTDNPDYRLTYPKIFKVEPDSFYASWLASAKKKYC